MNLEEATIKALEGKLNENRNNDDNPLIYKIILKDDTELDKEYINLRTAQEEAEKLDAKCVKQRYKYNDSDSLFRVFLKKIWFKKLNYLKYENNKFYNKTNSGWYEYNNQKDYFKMSVKLPPYLLGKYVDPYSVKNYGDTFIIIDTRDGSVYEFEDINDYYTIKDLKEQLLKILDNTYGENLYQPYFFDPLDY